MKLNNPFKTGQTIDAQDLVNEILGAPILPKITTVKEVDIITLGNKNYACEESESLSILTDPSY